MKKRILSLLFAAAIAFVGFNSCSDDDKSDFKPLPYRFIVVNEGNFGKATSDLSVIGTDNTIQNNVFERANQRTLGDIGQSAVYIDDKIYVPVNNSNKVEVIDAEDFESEATILFEAKTSSPIYILPLKENKAVVSDYAKQLTIINTEENTIIEKVELQNNITQMAESQGKIFGFAGNQLIIIDINNLKNQRTVDISSATPSIYNSKILKDKNSNIWMISTEKLVRINASTEKIDKEFLFAESALEVKSWPTPFIDINKAGNAIYLVAGNKGNKENTAQAIFKIDINSNSLPEKPLFELPTEIMQPYNMAVSPTETIVVCDAIDYSQSGVVYEYDAKGKELNKWTAGILPQFVLFAK